MMNKKEIILKSMDNVVAIYRDVGNVAQAIEQQVIANGYKAYGDAALTWENSTAYYGCESWLNRWFARVYFKQIKGEHNHRAVGYCIHLGGYSEENVNLMQAYGLKLPLITMSAMELETEVSKCYRLHLYDILWQAGWKEKQAIKIGKLAESKISWGGVTASTSTIAVNLLDLQGSADIEAFVVKNLMSLYETGNFVGSGTGLLPIG